MKKRIVICADGTWNRPEIDPSADRPTNVLRLARAIRPVGPAPNSVPQQVFYDWGVGSYYSKVVGGATGSGLNKNIMDDYRYIVQNYAAGDEIYLFGFSRGAYTVRSLCGMINNCGILKRPDARLIQAAFDLYKKPGKVNAPSGSNSVSFRQAHSHGSPSIRFVGVWDTVGAMGIPISFLGLLDDRDEFYDTKLGSNVEIARHALAIDELRQDFVPTVWTPKPGLDLKQVWFLGAHSDVGGSYPPDKDGTSLSDIALGWMVKQAEAAGLAVEAHLGASLRPNPRAKLHQSRRSFYRIKRKHHREIDHQQGAVLFHRSVKDRWTADPGYRPKHLKAWLAANSWPAALES